MPTPAEIVRHRRERRADQTRAAQGRARAAWFGLGYVFSIALAIAIFAFAYYYANLTRDLPSIEQLPILLNPTNGLLLQPTRLTDRTGEHTLFTFAPDNKPRVYVPLASLPDSLINAIIASAEPDFDSSPGYTLSGLDAPDSHPTLAQALAYNLLLFDEPPSLRRALRERLLAAQITARYGRDQVMEWTLNSQNFGNYAFGIDSAARLYFNKPASSLTLAESALLASVAQTPSLNPLAAPEAAQQQAADLLQQMKELGFIEDIPLPPISSPAIAVNDQTSPILSLALAQLATRYDRQRLERGGLVILTTIDFDLQTQTDCLAAIHLARLAGESPNTETCPAALNLTSPPSLLEEPSLAALILDPRAGQLLALTGDLMPRNPGALLTPFVYLTGFTRGLGPASLVWDLPTPGENPADFHGPLRLREALANDYLVPARDVLTQMGAQNAVNTARSFGLDLEPGAAFPNDSAPQSILDLSAAYGTFAALGLRNGQSFDDSIQPSIILRVESVDGATWLDWSQPESQSVVTPALAYLMNHILSDGPARWPTWGNPSPLDLGRPVAVKPGATDSADAWVIGYTPARLVAVWTGSDSPLPEATDSPSISGKGPGVRSTASLWSALIQYAVASLPPDGWTQPAGVSEIDVCDPSGLLPTNDCPSIVREVFLNGFEPTQGDTLFRSYLINRETGLLATVFTPPELVEARVFMVLPQAARAWAASAGLPVPPEAYDAIPLGAVNPNVNITSPAMFAEVGGKVQITGSAMGEGFQYYRIQVGQGLNPLAWIVIGGDVTAPVTNGPLAEWDASGLSGLYAIQLVVVYADQRVETAVIQVTVK
jgi:membrane peptidoglycan carboxypeptidase